MSVNKPNDWFLAVSENPTMNFEDFQNNGITVDNTALQSREFYRNSNYIQELFTDDTTGKFDEAAFNKQYDAAAQAYNIYANEQYEKDVLRDMEWDPYAAWRPNNSKIKTPDIQIIQEVNPLHQAKGFGRIGAISNPTITAYEAAQQQKVQDWKTKEFLDYSPNDRSLENSILGFVKSISEPLVMATYEEDGFHVDPFSGRRVKHTKGEYKINDQGEYYYETLGGRSAYGKEVKSVFDSLTVDGSTANNYDFFDSDGLDKSVAGTIAKTVAVVAPLFTPLAPYYGYAMIGAQLMDLLPSLYNTTIGVFVDTPEFLNQMQGIGRSFRENTTQHSKENLVTAENFFRLISDVALQWQQQTTISKLYNKAIGTDASIAKIQQQVAKKAQEHAVKKGIMDAAQAGEELTEEALKKGVMSNLQKSMKAAQEAVYKTQIEPLLKANNRTAANYALGYMAAMQGFQTFEDALAIGASEKEAALLTWGTIVGMYGIMRTGLGEQFFGDLQDTGKIAYNKAISELKDELAKGYSAISTTTNPTSKAFKLLSAGKKAGQKFWEGIKNHSLPFFGKAIGEGIEETSEELVADFFKVTHNIAADFGIASTENKFDLDDAFQRYVMSFAGGTIGGAVFGASDIFRNARMPKDLNQELTYLLRNGKKSEILGELENWRKKGRLGNTELSPKFSINSDGERFYETAESKEKSQNQANYDILKGYIESIDKTIHQEKLNFSDSDILDKLINADQRLASIQQAIGKNGINGRYLQRFNNITEDIINKDLEIQNYINTTQDQDKRKNPEFEENLKKLQKEKADLLKERDDFFSQENLVDYTNQLLFEIDDKVNKIFYTANFQQYIEGLTRKNMSELDKDTIDEYTKKYEVFKKASLDQKFNEAYTIFKNLNKDLTTAVNNQALTYEKFGELAQLVRDKVIDEDITQGKFAIKDTTKFRDISITGTDRIIGNQYMPLNFPVMRTFDPNVEGDFEAAQNEYSQAVEEFQNNLNDSVENITSIINRFKEIGFIDRESKDILLQPFSFIGKYIKTKSTQELWQMFGATNDQELQEKLSKTTLTASVFDEDIASFVNEDMSIESQIQNIIKAVQLLDGTEESLTEASKIGFRDYLGSDFSKSIISNILKPINQALKEDGFIGAYNQIQYELSNLEVNPLFSFLKQLSLNVEGAYPSILTLLEEENKKLKKLPLDEYELDSKIIDDIEQALQLLNITEALINAADSTPLSQDNLYGHNAVINSFSAEQGKPTEYGIIRSDLAVMMRQDLLDLRQKLEYLQNIHNINAANTFKAQEKTGNRMTYLLISALKGKEGYEKLKDIEINGIRLFDGVDEIGTPEYDKVNLDDPMSQDLHVEFAEIANKVFENFTKIVNSSDDIDQINSELVRQLISKFDVEDLITQRTSRLNQKIDAITDYDIINYILSLCSYQKTVFDGHVLDIVNREETKFVPLYPQLHVSYVGYSAIKNPKLFNTLLKELNVEEPIVGNDYINIDNSVFITGIGGAGKTSVVSFIINEIFKLDNPNNSTVWNASPTERQVQNLNRAIAPENSFDFDSLMEHILGKEDFAELSKDLENLSKENTKFYNVKFKKSGSQTASVYTINERAVGEVLKNTENPPKIIYIDEYTYMNTVYAQILSYYAKRTGAKIVFIGDGRQLEFRQDQEKEDKHYVLAGPSKDVVKGVRTPELNVSMRPTNIHQKKVNELLERVTRVFVDRVVGKDDLQDALDQMELILKEGSLPFYEGEESFLAGTKVVDNVSLDYIKELCRNVSNVAYVYDDTNSETYRLIQQLKSSDPELGNKITLYTQKEIQGFEHTLAIIDVDFSEDSLKDERSEKTSQKINTLLTRGLEGNVVIDRSFKNVFPVNNYRANYYAPTPDPSAILENYKKYVIEILSKTSQMIEIDTDDGGPEDPKTSDDINEAINNLEKIAIETQELFKNLNEADGIPVEDIDGINNALNDLRSQYESIDPESVPEEDHEELKGKINDLITNYTAIKNQINDALKEVKQNLENEIKKCKDKINFLEEDLEDLKDSTQYQSIGYDLYRIKDAMNQIMQSPQPTPENVEIIRQAKQLLEETQDKLKELGKSNKINPEARVSEENTQKVIEDVLLSQDAPKEQSDLQSGIRAYGYYKRKGNETNEDLGIFTSENQTKDPITGEIKKLPEEKIKHKLHCFRNFFFRGGNVRDDDDLDALMAQIGQSKNKKRREAIRNGSFKVIIDKFKESDIGFESTFDDTKIDKNGYMFRLVYSWQDPIPITEGEYIPEWKMEVLKKSAQKSITLGVLSSPESWIQGVKNYKNKKDRDIRQKQAEEYKKWYEAQIKMAKDTGAPVVYRLDDDQVATSGYDRIYQLTDRYNLSEFNDKNSDVIKSQVYIFSGTDGRLKGIQEELKEKGIELNSDADNWRGKSFVYASTAPYVKVKGTFFDGTKEITNGWVQVTPSNIEDLYFHMLSQGQDAAIRLLMLDSEGQFVIDQWDASYAEGYDNKDNYGYFHLDFSDIKDKKGRTNLLGSVGNTMTGLKMFTSLWNYRADLKKYLRALEEIAQEDVKLKEYLENDQYTEEIKTKLAQKLGEKFNITVPINGEDSILGYTQNGGFPQIMVSQYSAELQIRIIDNILENSNLSYAYDLNKDESKYYTKIRLYNTESVPNNVDEILQHDPKKAPIAFIEDGQNKVTIKASDDINYDSQEEELKFNKNRFKAEQSYNLIYLLSAINKYYGLQKDYRSDRNITIHSRTDKTVQQEVDLKDIIPMQISETITEEYLSQNDYTRSKLIRNLFAVVFHGVTDPYAGKGNRRKQQQPIGGTLFPKGVFYNPRYRYTTTSSVTSNLSDYYPVRLVEDDVPENPVKTEARFNLGCLIQSPYMILNSLPTKLDSQYEKTEILEESEEPEEPIIKQEFEGPKSKDQGYEYQESIENDEFNLGEYSEEIDGEIENDEGYIDESEYESEYEYGDESYGDRQYDAQYSEPQLNIEEVKTFMKNKFGIDITGREQDLNKIINTIPYDVLDKLSDSDLDMLDNIQAYAQRMDSNQIKCIE